MPAGLVDEHETVAAAAVRETKEETGYVAVVEAGAEGTGDDAWGVLFNGELEFPGHGMCVCISEGCILISNRC